MSKLNARRYRGRIYTEVSLLRRNVHVLQQKIMEGHNNGTVGDIGSSGKCQFLLLILLITRFQKREDDITMSLQRGNAQIPIPFHNDGHGIEHIGRTFYHDGG